jgi:hypothetical protein
VTRPVNVDRSAVLAYRAARQGLRRTVATVCDLEALDLGVQDSPPGSAAIALAARLTTTEAARDWRADDALTAAWSVRGAPHVHRRADLAGLAAALWPHDDADAASRLAWNATRVRSAGLPAAACVGLAAHAVAAVAATWRDDPDALDDTGLPVPRDDAGRPGLTKGLLSREVTQRLPDGLRHECRPCGVRHVSEQLLRLAVLPGGLRIDPGPPLTFLPFDGWTGVPDQSAGFALVVRAYLHRFGPATPSDAAAFLGASLGAVRAAWPDDVTAVTVSGVGPPRVASALDADLPVLLDPPDPPAIRLLPPNDGFLKAGDRAVLVPERDRQKAIWRIMGSPGVVLADAVPAGTWRAKASGKRLELSVEIFTPLDPEQRSALDDEAARLTAVRGLTPGRVTIT